MRTHSYLRCARLAAVGYFLFLASSRAMGQPGLPLDHREVLTMPAALQLLLEQNFDLQAQALEVGVARDELDFAWGEFDPQLFATTVFEDNTRKLNAIDYSSFGITGDPEDALYHEENERVAFGISGKLPVAGTQVELSSSLNRLENDVNREGRFFFPEYESGVNLTVTQPLLRGFMGGATMAGVRSARYSVRIAERSREIEVINKMIELTDAYLDLAFAQENIEVKQRAVALAETLREENRQRAEVGKMTRLDVTQAEVQVSEALEEQVLAMDFARNRRLRVLMLLMRDFDGTALPQFKVEADLTVSGIRPDVRALADSAFERRPDLLLASDEVGKSHLERKRARASRLPQLDLRFSYGVDGLDDGFYQSVRQLPDREADQWSAGFVMTMPLMNRQERASARIAQSRAAQAELSAASLRTRISLEVSNGVERLDSLRERLANATKSRELSSAGLEVELARLEAGQSTSFAVLDLQQKASEAETRELAARVDLKKSEVELWATAGVLPDRLGLLINPVEIEPKSRRLPSLSNPFKRSED